MKKEELCNGYNKEYIHPYKERLNLNINEKKEIAEKAMLFVHDNGVYYFDVSTNVELLAKKLDKKSTIYTHSIDNFNILSEKENVTLKLIGGDFNEKNRFFYREDYKIYFKDINFDAVFLGAGAIRKDGVYYPNKEDALIKCEAAKRSKKVILLAEHQKYEKSTCYKGINLDDIDIIIVDPISVNSFSQIIEEQNIKINPHSIIIM